jgi:hypothetical protein
MSNQPDVTNPLDPFGVWREATDAGMQTLRQARDANIEAWSRLMIDFVNSEAYSRATNEWLDTYLLASQPFQQVLQRTMAQVLGGLNMPVREEVTGLAQRLINVETRLDDLDARLDEILRAIKALSTPEQATHTPARAKEVRS